MKIEHARLLSVRVFSAPLTMGDYRSDRIAPSFSGDKYMEVLPVATVADVRAVWNNQVFCQN